MDIFGAVQTIQIVKQNIKITMESHCIINNVRCYMEILKKMEEMDIPGAKIEFTPVEAEQLGLQEEDALDAVMDGE